VKTNMTCKMSWKRAMEIARKEYPKLSLKKRRRIAARIMRKK